MPVNAENFRQLSVELKSAHVELVAVSKTKPVSDILELYQLGQRDFGENYVQELIDKQAGLPGDIRWHFIGHLQTNKVRLIAPLVYLIHGVDSFKLLSVINQQGARLNRRIKCLLQVHIAEEESKFGLTEDGLHSLLDNWTNQEETEYVQICGLMGMATFTSDKLQVSREFQMLKNLFDKVQEKYFYHDDQFRILSMGMSDDYRLAVAAGSTMVRVGSLLFGTRNAE